MDVSGVVLASNSYKKETNPKMEKKLKKPPQKEKDTKKIFLYY
jgi:hypothetical protein